MIDPAIKTISPVENTKWQRPRAPEDNEILLWLVSGNDLPLNSTLLSSDESRRSAQMPARRQREFVVGRMLLRSILGYMTAKAPQQLVFDYSQIGKPRLKNGPHFSLAHSHGLIGLAVCRSEIGLDIEFIRPYPRRDELARRLFGGAIANSIATDQDFFKYWCSFEARQKSSGEGVFSKPVTNRQVLYFNKDGYVVALAGVELDNKDFHLQSSPPPDWFL